MTYFFIVLRGIANQEDGFCFVSTSLLCFEQLLFTPEQENCELPREVIGGCGPSSRSQMMPGEHHLDLDDASQSG